MVPSEQINRNHVKYTQVHTHLGYFSDVIHGPLYAMLTFVTMTFYVWMWIWVVRSHNRIIIQVMVYISSMDMYVFLHLSMGLCQLQLIFKIHNLHTNSTTSPLTYPTVHVFRQWTRGVRPHWHLKAFLWCFSSILIWMVPSICLHFLQCFSVKLDWTKKLLQQKISIKDKWHWLTLI